MPYKAFISYNHESDGKLAPILKSALRKVAKPWYRLPPFQIFLDTLSMGPPVLWPAIEKALSESEYFLLLASPRSAASEWVAKEIQWWLAQRDLQSLIIVLTAGELVWSNASGGFDPQRTTALPAELTGRFHEEPLFVDLRWASAERNLSLRHSLFRDAVLDIASPLHDKPRDVLDDEDVHQYRIARRLAVAAIIGLAALSIATGGAAYVARRAQFAERSQRMQAEERRIEAEAARNNEAKQRRLATESAAEATRQRDLAICRQLAAQSVSQLDRRLDLALLLAIEAHHTYGCAEASNSLLMGLQHQPRLLRFLTGHSNVVTDVAYSADGKMLATTGWDFAARLWDPKTGRPIGRPLKPAAYGVVFSRDGRALITSDGGESLAFWNVGERRMNGGLLRGHQSTVSTVELSPDGKLIASGTEATGTASSQVHLWNAETRKPVGPPLPGYRHAFSPDGKVLATSGEDRNTVVLWDIEKRVKVGLPLEGHTKSIRSLAFSPDGERLASGGEDNLVIVWDLEGRAARTLSAHRFPVNDVSFSHDGKVLASASGDGTVVLWDAESLRPIGPPLAVGGPVLDIEFSPDDHTLASTSGDDRAVIWNLATDLQIGRAFAIPKAGGSNVALSPDGRTLAFTDSYNNVVLWDMESAKQKDQFDDRVTALAFSSDGGTLATVSLDGFLSLWDVRADQPVGRRYKLGDFRLWSVRFSPDDRTVACGGDAVFLLWDIQSRKPAGGPDREQKDRIWSVAFSPDGKVAASGGNRGAMLRRLSGGGSDLLPAESFPGLYRTDVAFSPDGRLLAYPSGERTITIWDAVRKQRDGQPLQREKGGVSALAFSPDGRMLVSGGRDGTLILWDVATRQQLGRPIPAHEDDVQSIAFRADGRVLVSIGQEKLIVWDFDPESWVRSGCRIANRNLTEAEWLRYRPDVPQKPTCHF